MSNAQVPSRNPQTPGQIVFWQIFDIVIVAKFWRNLKDGLNIRRPLFLVWGSKHHNVILSACFVKAGRGISRDLVAVCPHGKQTLSKFTAPCDQSNEIAYDARSICSQMVLADGTIWTNSSLQDSPGKCLMSVLVTVPSRTTDQEPLKYIACSDSSSFVNSPSS